MRKGFTLIELLAVIVILAIIALIATPIILGIINDAKDDSNKRSVENYAHAVELAVARAATKQGGVIEPGIYSIEDEGKTIKKGTTEIQIDYKGEAIKAGELEVFIDGKIELRGLSFNGKSTYNYSESNGVTAGEVITPTKEITHLVLPDGTLVFYTAKGDIKVPATIDGITIKSMGMYPFEPKKLIILSYIGNPEECALDEEKCTYALKVYSLDSNITKEEIKYYIENYLGYLIDDNNIVYPKSSSEILSDYNNLVSQGIEVEEVFAQYLEFENGVVADEWSNKPDDITSIDLSELNNITIDGYVFYEMQNLKTVTLPKMEIISDRIFTRTSSLEKVIVPYKEGEIPAGWTYDWNYDSELYKYHTIEYAG